MSATYLVDANVLSEPTRPNPQPIVIEWLAANETGVVVDAIILGELRIGVFALPAGSRRSRLEHWLDEVASAVRCLPWDAAVSRRWSKLVVDLRRKGRTMPILDSMIAATALHHDLVIATRNTRDFGAAGVRVVDPFRTGS